MFIKLDHLIEVEFVRNLHCKVTLSFPFPYGLVGSKLSWLQPQPDPTYLSHHRRSGWALCATQQSPTVIKSFLYICMYSLVFIFLLWVIIQHGLPWWLSIKESACSAGATGDMNLIPGSGRSPWGRAWPPTPVFLPGESHGQAVHKDSDTAEAT